MSKLRRSRRARYRTAKAQLPVNDRVKVRIMPDLRAFNKAIKRLADTEPR